MFIANDRFSIDSHSSSLHILQPGPEKITDTCLDDHQNTNQTTPNPPTINLPTTYDRGQSAGNGSLFETSPSPIFMVKSKPISVHYPWLSQNLHQSSFKQLVKILEWVKTFPPPTPTSPATRSRLRAKYGRWRGKVLYDHAHMISMYTI